MRVSLVGFIRRFRLSVWQRPWAFRNSDWDAGTSSVLRRRSLRITRRLSIIREVLVQEKDLFEGRKVSDRIVSIDRHYVRPIVRGKEIKSVEFGAKVNKKMAYEDDRP